MSVHLVTEVVVQSGGGITDFLGAKNQAVANLFRGISITLGLGFVIWHGLKSRGALTKIITAGIAAGVFIWIVFNVTSIKDRVNNEMNTGSPTVSTTVHQR